MSRDIGIALPALEKNRYSPFGDLVKFAGSTLLEWKIVQLLKISKKENIFVATPSAKVLDVAEEYGVNIIKREGESSIHEMMFKITEKIDREHIMWTNATSPFLGPRHYNDIINKYFKLDKEKYDSIVTVLKMQEYIMYRDKPLNFDLKLYKERRVIEPVSKITNGCSIVKREATLKYKKDLGTRPFLYEVDKFAAMEISEIDDNAIMSDLVAHYFRRDLDIIDRDLWHQEASV